ncbi:MAG TPA: hypothetical protein VJB12_03055 [Candidatus Nanoarchaeia archaeon]|nr:hypothetical protein [Candidatus Nanoarchaeia archaeon]
MDIEDTARKLEGLHTIETAMEALGMTRQSAINFLSRLKKEGFMSTRQGPKKRLYRITPYRQRPRYEGMFDILNKYNPTFQLSPWYDHQVHGKYGVEDAILDAIDTHSFRAILATLRLFGRITDWPYLYREAKRRGSWQKVGALHEVARMNFRMRPMPRYYGPPAVSSWRQMTQLKDRGNFPDVQQKWKIFIPFNKKDIDQVRVR